MLPSLDLDDLQRPPNTLMMYGGKYYAGAFTLVQQTQGDASGSSRERHHQIYRHCLKEGPEDTKVDVLPLKLS